MKGNRLRGMLICQVLWTLGLCFAPLFTLAFPFRGRVLDAKTGEPLESAQVFLADLNLGTLSNRNGEFTLGGKLVGIHRLMVTYVGYETYTTSLHFPVDTFYTVRLNATSLALEDVVVTARAAQKSGTALHINQAALEHTQPSSLADVLQFLPGQLATDGRLDEVKQVSLRQVGNDDNTALGTAVLVNGVPISNNANLNALSADQKLSERSTVNAGIDLRMLSTDHYERVELLRGIASARLGDLSSGALVLRAKQGVTPWQLRAKVDPLSTLVYLGKGLRLPLGTLHLGGEYTTATPDEREQLERYSRYSAQANWTVKTTIATLPLSFALRANYIGALTNERTDPDLTLRNEKYLSYYARYQTTADAELFLDKKWISSLHITLSYDYTEDVLRRNSSVSLYGAQGMPLPERTGEYEAIYLPAYYFTQYSLVNKPFLAYALVEARENVYYMGLNHAISIGLETRIEGNFGRGYNYDEKHPPLPMATTASRPRRYSDLPYYIPLSAYIEDKITATGFYGELELTAGIRMGYLRDASTQYEALQAPQFDPRLNAYYALPRFNIGKQQTLFAIRLGWGKQTKWPTLDQLAPAPAYFDFQSLNYYSQTEEWRLLWLTTFKENTRNTKLRPASYNKWEAGIDCKMESTRLAFTAFYESMDNGFTYSTHYKSFEYNVYKVTTPPMAKPDITTLTPQKVYALQSIAKPANSLKTVKKGFEFTLSLPKWHLVETSADLSGAYWHTTYDVSEPVEYRPSHTGLDGKEYPYVGIYAWSNGKKYEQLSTTLRLYTHFSKLRFLFTTQIQCIWFEQRTTIPFDGRPTYYRNIYGELNPFTNDLAKDPELTHLVQNFGKHYFDPDTTPLALSLNLKATKEIGKHTRLSLFVNRLWAYLPDYRAKYNRLVTRDYTPYFGAELRISI